MGDTASIHDLHGLNVPWLEGGDGRARDCPILCVTGRDVLETYLRAYETEYPRIKATMVARLAEWHHDQGTERDLAESLDAPRMIVRHLLEMLAARGLITVAKPVGGPQGWRFYGVSARLRRIADQ